MKKIHISQTVYLISKSFYFKFSLHPSFEDKLNAFKSLKMIDCLALTTMAQQFINANDLNDCQDVLCQFYEKYDSQLI